MTQRKISYIENDTFEPSLADIQAFCRFFHVSADYLLEKAPAEEGRHTVDLSDIDFAFYGQYKELSEDDKQTIMDMVRVMRQRRNRDTSPK